MYAINYRPKFIRVSKLRPSAFSRPKNFELLLFFWDGGVFCFWSVNIIGTPRDRLFNVFVRFVRIFRNFRTDRDGTNEIPARVEQ